MQSPAPQPARRPTLTIAAAALLLGAAAGLAACNQTTAEPNKKPDAATIAAVETARPVRANMSAIYSGTAPIEADQEARVVAKVAGEVRRILVEEGDTVREGQSLAILDGDKLRLQLAESRANLAKLEHDYARNAELQKRGLIGGAAFDTLRYELDAQRASSERAALELSYTEIRAPIAGVVAERRIKVGNTLAPGDLVFVVSRPNPLIAHVHVPEREISKLAVGQQAEAEVDAARGRFSATIRRVSPVVDPVTGTFKVTLEFTPDPRLRAGMFARINIVYERREQALAIPRSALIDSDAGATVYVVDKGKAALRIVHTGLVNGADVEVLSGLTDRDVVVVVGQSGLKAGNEVKVVAAAPVTAGRGG